MKLGAATTEAAEVQSFLDFINESVTPFHAVQAAATRLQAAVTKFAVVHDLLYEELCAQRTFLPTTAGFQQIYERASWETALKRGGRYYFTRNQSSIVAFAVGKKFEPTAPEYCSSGFAIIGAHTDSPCIRLKPITNLKKAGCLCLNVTPYGGGLWHTWFDRDLSVAGRVIVRDGEKVRSKLVRLSAPILRIPNLAIHLTSDEERHGFNPNAQTNLPPVFATEVQASKLMQPKDGEPGAPQHHHPLLLELVAKELAVPTADILDLELQLYDVQPGTTGGALGEFIFSGRLDNLCSSWQALTSLIDSCADPAALEEESNVRLIALFDHEEIGSVSAQGATSTLVPEALRRICHAFGSESRIEQVLRASFVVSADMAHCVHPNYEQKHDSLLAPKFHGGMVLKHNVNQRYATSSATAEIFRAAGRRAGCPVQEFAVRADSRCGSTIGPLLSGLTGIATVDVGSPQWAMHSIRETMACEDVLFGYKHFRSFFEVFRELKEQHAELLDH